MEIILASTSPRRAELLKQIGMSFKIIPSRFAETIPVSFSPGLLVEDLALNKVKEVAQRVSSGLIIGADTMVFLAGELLGKPSGPMEATQMLTRLSGQIHLVYTGIALIEVPSQTIRVAHEITEVKFRSLQFSEIEAYVASGEPLDKAGAYGIQGKGAVLVERINGCYYNVVGLPISKLVTMLQEFRVSIW